MTTLQEHLHTEVSPMCILPPEPIHDVSPRESGVSKITPPQSTQKVPTITAEAPCTYLEILKVENLRWLV